MRSQTILCFVAGLVVIASLGGCTKKRGQAVVLEKEHIAAKEVSAKPEAETSASPTEPVIREMRDDEIDADGIVMKKDVRGTSRDPRAISEEQWIVKVQTISDLRRFKIQADKSRWEKIKVGDRLNVSYRVGNYTGTVWGAEIE